MKIIQLILFLFITIRSYGSKKYYSDSDKKQEGDSYVYKSPLGVHFELGFSVSTYISSVYKFK